MINLRRVMSDLETLAAAGIATWRTGETLLLTGRLLTARDAARQRLVDLLARGEPLPEGVDFSE
jgi:fumarate hydratase class I